MPKSKLSVCKRNHYKIDGKWKPLILIMLNKRPTRFNKIKQLMGDISSKVLSETMVELVQDDLVSKNDTEYTITLTGTIVCQHLEAIYSVLDN